MTKLYTCLLIPTVVTAMPAFASEIMAASMAQSGSAAHQSVATAAPAVKRDLASPKKDKLICKRAGDFETGSHLRRASKKCMRASEWKEREDIAERFLRAVNDRAGVRDTPSPATSPPL